MEGTWCLVRGAWCVGLCGCRWGDLKAGEAPPAHLTPTRHAPRTYLTIHTIGWPSITACCSMKNQKVPLPTGVGRA